MKLFQESFLLTSNGKSPLQFVSGLRSDFEVPISMRSQELSIYNGACQIVSLRSLCFSHKLINLLNIDVIVD